MKKKRVMHEIYTADIMPRIGIIEFGNGCIRPPTYPTKQINKKQTNKPTLAGPA
jgi:hypothetical protein